MTNDAYIAIQETEPCKRCGEGESWTVKGPDGVCIGQSWTGDDAACNAEEMAQALNAAYEAGQKSREPKPNPIMERLRSLPIIGVINVDDPSDPRHKEWKL